MRRTRRKATGRAKTLLGIWRTHSVSPTKALGRRGERAAVRYLRKRGYRILDRNVESRVGEIDILALAPEGEALVVVEVKTRVAPEGGGGLPADRLPERSVTAHKRRKLLALARSLQRRERYRGVALRIDVIGVEFPAQGRGKPVIRHHVAAVRG